MSNVLDDIFEDSQEKANVDVSDDTLKQVSKLAMQQQEMEAWVERAEAKLQEVKEQLRHLTEITLPSAMDEVGLTEFKLADGSKVTVKPFYSASIPADRKQEAFGWLENNGFGDLIKNEIIAKFGRGDNEHAKELLTNLRDQGYDAEQKESVHAQTLKAFVREQVEAGGAVPLDLFGAHIGRKTAIKKGK